MGIFGFMLISILFVAFFIFVYCVLACWNESLYWWCSTFGTDLGESLYKFNIQVNNYLKNFWK